MNEINAIYCQAFVLPLTIRSCSWFNADSRIVSKQNFLSVSNLQADSYEKI